MKLTSLPTGACWTDQRDPFQRFTSGPTSPPTARQALDDEHETAVNAAPLPDPARVLRQRDPPHRSTSVDDRRNGPSLVANVDPTAMQNRLDTQDTPANEPDRSALMRGSSLTIQREPSQPSTMGRVTAVGPIAIDPTATQNVLDVHESALILPVGAEPCIDHAPPLHTSVSAPLGPDPTATQNPADGHETAVRFPPGIKGAGTDWTAQLAADARSPPGHATARTAPNRSARTNRRRVTAPRTPRLSRAAITDRSHRITPAGPARQPSAFPGGPPSAWISAEKFRPVRLGTLSASRV